MKLLILDSDGVSLDFAMRSKEAGHEVKVFMRKDHEGRPDQAGRGLIDKVPEWEKWIAWADLIVPTMNQVYLDKLDELRKLGYPIFGPSKQSAMLEINRGYGMEVFKKHGIEIPPYKMFRNLDQAESHCWKKDERYVFKTLGSEEDKSLSYVAKDSGDMISTIRRWKRTGKKLKGQCMLQDFVKGVEFGVSAWMGSNGFLGLRGENVEHKKLMSGNYGQNTGETGTLMWYAAKSKLAKQVLDPLEAELLKMGHRGDFDMNVIIDEKGKPWVLEATARLGWPAFFIMCSQHDEPCQWMLDAMNGKDTLKASMQPHIGVLVTIPPFPNKHAERSQVQGLPVYGITPENWEQIHLCQIMLGKDAEVVNGKPKMKELFVTSGEYVLVVTGTGTTIRKARRDAYRVVDEIHVRNKMVRDDIGEAFMDDLPALQAHGYATQVSA